MGYYRKTVLLWLLIVLLLLLGFSFASGLAAEKKKTKALPSLSIPESKFVFSKVIEGTKILHTFVIKNKGMGILEIQKVRTG